jgi:hypothetical protein
MLGIAAGWLSSRDSDSCVGNSTIGFETREAEPGPPNPTQPAPIIQAANPAAAATFQPELPTVGMAGIYAARAWNWARFAAFVGDPPLPTTPRRAFARRSTAL